MLDPCQVICIATNWPRHLVSRVNAALKEWSAKCGGDMSIANQTLGCSDLFGPGQHKIRNLAFLDIIAVFL